MSVPIKLESCSIDVIKFIVPPKVKRPMKERSTFEDKLVIPCKPYWIAVTNEVIFRLAWRGQPFSTCVHYHTIVTSLIRRLFEKPGLITPCFSSESFPSFSSLSPPSQPQEPHPYPLWCPTTLAPPSFFKHGSLLL